MCYRFYIDVMDDKDKELREIIHAAEKSLLAEKFRNKLSKPLVTSGEVSPTDVTAVIAPGRNKPKAVFPMKWGFTLKGSKQPLVNARTVTYLCGLYRFEEDYPVFTVLTREPSEELARIHDRMPLIFPKDMIDEWIRPDAKPEELIQFALTDMVFEKS